MGARLENNSLFLSCSAQLGRCMNNPQHKMGMNLVIAMAKAKLERSRQRNRARIVTNCMHGWVGTRILTRLLVFSKRIKRMQQWWRESVQDKQADINRISSRWAKLEHDAALKQIREDDKKLGQVAPGVSADRKTPPLNEKARKRQMKMTNALSIEDRVALRVCPEARRLDFITNELRTRRYNNLPATDLYRAALVSWNRAMEERRELKKAGLSEGMPLFPPVRPSYLPNDTDIIDMYTRAKKHPDGGGWIEIDLSKSREKAQNASMKARRASEARRAFEDELEMMKVGLEVRNMPGYHGRKPSEFHGAGGPLAHSSPLATPRAMPIPYFGEIGLPEVVADRPGPRIMLPFDM